MGPPGIPSFGGMFPSTGLGAAAALCREQNQDKHGGMSRELRGETHLEGCLFCHIPMSHFACYLQRPKHRCPCPEHLPSMEKQAEGHRPLRFAHGEDVCTKPGDNSRAYLFLYPGI